MENTRAPYLKPHVPSFQKQSLKSLNQDVIPLSITLVTQVLHHNINRLLREMLEKSEQAACQVLEENNNADTEYKANLLHIALAH